MNTTKPVRRTSRERHQAILDTIDATLSQYDFAYLDDPYAIAVRRGVVGGQHVG